MCGVLLDLTPLAFSSLPLRFVWSIRERFCPLQSARVTDRYRPAAVTTTTALYLLFLDIACLFVFSRLFERFDSLTVDAQHGAI